MTNSRFYIKLVEDINDLIQKADLEACFQRLKDYIPRNYRDPEMTKKYQEVVHLQGSFSRINADKRQRLIGYSEYNSEWRVIAHTIQDILGILKPDEIEIDFKEAFVELDSKSNFWSFENNLIAILVFPEDFGLLKSEFDKFREYVKSQGLLRVDRYFWDGSRKIMINEIQLNSLNDQERDSITVESMDWYDAIIFQKRDLDDVVLSEALVQKSTDDESIIVRANGSFIHDKSSILFDTINWFSNIRFPSRMTNPFYVKIPFNSLSVFEMISRDNN